MKRKLYEIICKKVIASIYGKAAADRYALRRKNEKKQQKTEKKNAVRARRIRKKEDRIFRREEKMRIRQEKIPKPVLVVFEILSLYFTQGFVHELLEKPDTRQKVSQLYKKTVKNTVRSKADALVKKGKDALFEECGIRLAEKEFRKKRDLL